MLLLGNRISNGASRRCNVDTGRLRAAMYFEMTRNVNFEAVVRVGNHTNYARFVHNGTAPHIIRPNPPRQFLRFPGRTGAIVFARQVHHPGYGGNPFLLDAAREEVARF